MEPGSAAIVTKDLTKRFGSFTAVKGVSFEVRRGEVFGLLGPNGAGKTTLVRMLTTLLPHDLGTGDGRGRGRHRAIRRACANDRRHPAGDDLGPRSDRMGEYRHLRRVLRDAARQRRERAQRLLELVGLRDRAQDLVATYSGGMRRRLEIARGLIHSPQVLFLDEPTIGLDPQSRLAVHDLLEQLCARKAN